MCETYSALLIIFNISCYILVCPGILIFFDCAILFIFPFEMDLINSSCRDLADTYWCCLFSSDLRKAHLFSSLILVQSAPRPPLKILFTFSYCSFNLLLLLLNFHKISILLLLIYHVSCLVLLYYCILVSYCTIVILTALSFTIFSLVFPLSLLPSLYYCMIAFYVSLIYVLRPF